MQTIHSEVPTWDHFLRPLLEQAAISPIRTRAATDQIAIDYEFSEPERTDLIYHFSKPGTKDGLQEMLSNQEAEDLF